MRGPSGRAGKAAAAIRARCSARWSTAGGALEAMRAAARVTGSLGAVVGVSARPGAEAEAPTAATKGLAVATWSGKEADDDVCCGPGAEGAPDMRTDAGPAAGAALLAGIADIRTDAPSRTITGAGTNANGFIALGAGAAANLGEGAEATITDLPKLGSVASLGEGADAVETRGGVTDRLGVG